MRIHEEVSEALAAGRPVVALESTIISHGLPRPRNLDVAREIEAAVRAAGAVPGDDRARRRGGADRARRRRAGGDRRLARTSSSAACATSRRPPRAARTGRRRSPPRRRSPCAPGSACSRRAASAACTARRARRWDESADLGTLARDADHRRVRGREVDPRRRRDARAARDAQRHRARLRHRRVPRLLSRRLGLPGAVAGRLARGGGRGDARARAALGGEAAIVVANPLPEAEQLDPELHDARARGRARRGGARGRHAARTRRRSCSTSSTARPAARASRSTCGSCCATPRWRRGSPPRA